MQSEVIALLFPALGPGFDGSTPLVTALVRDVDGVMEVRQLRPDRTLLHKARVAGRLNCGTPIIDPVTREVIGYEIDPIAVPAA